MASLNDNEIAYDVRSPCPTEERCIIRHGYRYYNNIIVAAVYKLPSGVDAAQATALTTYLPALRTCLREHPFLSTTLTDRSKGRQEYARISRVDLVNHFRVFKLDVDLAGFDHKNVAENEVIAGAMEHIHNDPNLTFFHSATTSPAWRIDLLPLRPEDGRQRVWLGFTYAHHVGDGMSGLIFHDTLFKALATSISRPVEETSPIYHTSHADLAMLPKLPISLSYLLTPALGHYLPTFISKIFGLRASVSGSGPDTWKGQNTFLNSPSSIPPITTAVEVLAIDSSTLSNLLSACRKHNAKLTSLLNALIALCMSLQLSKPSVLTAQHTNFVSATATNIRKTCGVSDKTIGAFASVGYSLHEIDRSGIVSDGSYIVNDEVWSAAKINSAELAKGVSTLQDHPIGLLSWISDLDSWMKDQMDKPRDASWLLSNLLAFDGKLPEASDVEVEKTFFCSPADGVGAPLDFNVVSVRDGELIICAGWQVGAIGLKAAQPVDSIIADHERLFVQAVLKDLQQYIEVASR